MACQETQELTYGCPRCGSDAYYRYGRTRQGQQRFRCLMCGRQFVGCGGRVEIPERPVCEVCGKKMYVYRHDPDGVRFRCAGYPKCRNYKKKMKE